MSESEDYIESYLKGGSSGSSGMCAPLVIYLVLVAANIFWIGTTNKIPEGQKAKQMIISLLIAALIGAIMYELCKNGHSGWSWFILLLPLIWMIMAMLF